MVCSALCSDRMNTAPQPPPCRPPNLPCPPTPRGPPGGTVPSAVGMGELLPSED